jgi:S1-C subfamily serine protease
VGSLRAENEALDGRISSTDKRLNQKEAGIAPLAARALKSVFTIEAAGWYGAGFAAWTEDGHTYLITANHVVAHAVDPLVTVVRKGGSWSGQIVGTDRADDLAVIRVNGNPAAAKPLWQEPVAHTPRVGDELLLIGSPFGLQGTVTSGVVSRVTTRVIQTDAAANPGNSGGPALDRNGNVVGVLLAGAGENLNFTVPVGRVCLKLRAC